MAHECEECGEECYCDQDDTGGLYQPANCPHFAMHAKGLYADGSRMFDDLELEEDLR